MYSQCQLVFLKKAEAYTEWSSRVWTKRSHLNVCARKMLFDLTSKDVSLLVTDLIRP